MHENTPDNLNAQSTKLALQFYGTLNFPKYFPSYDFIWHPWAYILSMKKKLLQIYKHNVKQKMPYTKKSILYDSISIKFKAMAKPICDVRVKIVVAGLGAG